MSKLNELQERWIVEFLRCGNQAEAARCAGYSTKYANQAGWRNYKNPEIVERVKERMDELKKKSIAEADEVLQYLTKVLRGESVSEIVVVESVGDYRSEARRVDKAPDEKEKLKAAELLAKRYGLLTDALIVSEVPKVIDDV